MHENVLSRYKVALAQMDATADEQDNLRKIEEMLKKAATQGVSLFGLPEMACVHPATSPYTQIAQTLEGPYITRLSELAKEYGIWIQAGSFLESIPESKLVYNTSVLLDELGRIQAIYRKRQLFDIDLENRSFRESDDVKAGERETLVDTRLGRIGFGICYDVRFPEQFRAMGHKGMQVLMLPASFVYETGEAHWEILTRARAIENGCYVLACNQCGKKSNYMAYGHSQIIDPWGRILAKANDQEQLLLADIDLSYTKEVKENLPSTTMYQ